MKSQGQGGAGGNFQTTNNGFDVILCCDAMCLLPYLSLFLVVRSIVRWLFFPKVESRIGWAILSQ